MADTPLQNQHTLFTIGYASFFDIDKFLAALTENSIGALVDVRGFPEIASFDHYKGQNLKKILSASNIHYLSFAQEFGVRPQDDAFYTDNAVDFGKIAKSGLFKSGCDRLKNGLEKFNICLMCAEKDPAVCHRAVLVTREFEKLHPETPIRHILPGALLTQRDIDDALKKRYALFDGSLDACYKIHGKAIAYRKK